MERLTETRGDVTVYTGPWCEYETGMIPAELRPDHVRQVLNRLASYEDTGLEPEEVTDLQRAWDMYGGEEGITALAEKANAALPPNAPLTLAELREMDGEPVYIVGINGARASGWGLVRCKARACQTFFAWYLFFEWYGKTWIAYRRKPEEGNK